MAPRPTHIPVRELIFNKLARRRPRPPVAFIAWSTVGGRSHEVAAALGGEARCFNDLRIVSKWLIPLRYAISSMRTVAYLAQRRPRAVIVTNPPVFPGMIATLYGHLTGARVVLDSHPSAYGLNGDRLAVKMIPLSRFIARRAESSLVTGQDLVRRTEEWGARADVLHEAAPEWSLPPISRGDGRPRALLVGRFAHDEPTGNVVEAARLVPEIDIEITGDPRKCPPELREAAPENVHFVGFLHGDDYLKAIERAEVVLALSDRSQTVSRGASEAVWGGRPLIVSDWPEARAAFPFAIHIQNDPESIAEALRTAFERHGELAAQADDARRDQLGRWHEQVGVLRALVGLAPSDGLVEQPERVRKGSGGSGQNGRTNHVPRTRPGTAHR
jgi:glycosyltransferase involved in cell wall biosynthesis